MTARRPPSPPANTFAALGVPASLTRVLAAAGVTTPFPIQVATLPDALAGRDVLGRGQTGSGKTYAFVLPLLARLAAGTSARRPGRPRALILAPTRELATQIHTAMAPLAQALSLRTLTIFGGIKPTRDIAGLRAGVDVLVACPGRLADHAAAGHVDLSAVEITVLDEADHMADLGFLPVVTRLLERTPRSGQRLLFSATLDGAVDVLVRRFLTNPVRHSVGPTASPTAETAHHVLHVHAADRFAVLAELTAAAGRTIVFTRTKRGARTLTRRLVAVGVPAVELHGDLAQSTRSRNLQAFTGGTVGTLVATDIAARGIHVDDVALVIHADPPAEHKAYLHRSGRTARAGASGTVVTLMTDTQVPEVSELTRKAGITATITQARPGDQLLTQFAPGHRPCPTTPPGDPAPAPAPAAGPARSGRARRTQASRVPRRAGQGSAQPPSAAGPGSGHNATATPASGARLSGAAAFSSRARVGRR